MTPDKADDNNPPIKIIRGNKKVFEYLRTDVCPYCREEDFDLIGLKYHLTWYCNPYKQTETID